MSSICSSEFQVFSIVVCGVEIFGAHALFLTVLPQSHTRSHSGSAVAGCQEYNAPCLEECPQSLTDGWVGQGVMGLRVVEFDGGQARSGAKRVFRDAGECARCANL